jgi:hypothetical protein
MSVASDRTCACAYRVMFEIFWVRLRWRADDVMRAMISLRRSKFSPFKFDVTCEREVGVQNSRLLAAYVATDARLTALTLFAKQWAKECGALNPQGGTVLCVLCCSEAMT